MAANELRTELTNDASQFNQSMDQATDKVEKFQDKVDDAKDSVDDLGKKGAMSTKDLVKELGKLSGQEKSLSNYRRQLSQMTKDIQDLTINYSRLTKEQQNSDVGKATLQRIQELTQKAGEYRDVVADAQQAINAYASDTMYWDAAKQGIQSVSAALQGIASSGLLGQKTTDQLVQALSHLKAIETATNSVITLGNALQKQSSLLTGIRAVQTKALTAATNLQTKSTVAATVAQKALNAVARANPYVLLATAVLAVGTALVAFTKHSAKAKKAQEEQEKAAKKAEEAVKKEAEAFDNYKSKVGGAVGDVTSKFRTLQLEYKNLTGEMEKKRWIEENKNAFDDLGLAITDVNSANQVFIDRADDVIAAMMAIAKVEGLKDLYKDTIKEEAQAQIQALKDQENAVKNAYKAPKVQGTVWGNFPKEWKEAGLSEKEVKFEWAGGQSGAGKWILTPEQEARVNKYYEDLGKAAAKEASDEVQTEISNTLSWLEDQIKNATRDAEGAKAKVADLMKTPTTTPTGGNKGGSKGGSGGSKSGPEKEYKSQIKLLEEAIKKQQDLLPYVEDQSEEEAKILNTIVELNKQLDEAKKKHDEFLVSLRKQRTGQIAELPVIPAIKGPTQIELPDKYKSGLVLPVKPEYEPAYLDEVLDGLVEDFDQYSGFADGLVGGFKGVYDSIKGLGDALDEAEGPLESFFALWQTGMQVFQFATTVLEAVSTLTTILNGGMGIQIGMKKKDTQTTEENTRAKLKNAGADAAAAIAGGAKSVADIPVVGWVLAGVAAATLLATLLSAMNSAKGFASGGIVGGNSYTGDKILARLNSGELVLNKKQQTQLWDEMNAGVRANDNNGGRSQVEFKINGTQLVGVLNNINRKNSNI